MRVFFATLVVGLFAVSFSKTDSSVLRDLDVLERDIKDGLESFAETSSMTRDSACSARGGLCQSNPCVGGHFEGGLCLGPADRRCCIPSGSTAPTAADQPTNGEMRVIQNGAIMEYTPADGGSEGKIFIAFGGWSVTMSSAEIWVKALYAAKLRDLGYARLFIVKGPNNSLYPPGQREISVGAIGRRLEEIGGDFDITVAAHSSGNFVSLTLFAALPASIKARTTYYALDGWGGKPSGLKKIYAVYAQQDGGSTLSSNARSMLGTREETIKLLCPRVCCSNGGIWSLHMFLINKCPHDPAGLRVNAHGVNLDYRSFDPSHQIQTDWIKE